MIPLLFLLLAQLPAGMTPADNYQRTAAGAIMPAWYSPTITAAAIAAQATPEAPAVVWSLASGTLPPGVSLLPDGRLTGTPSAAGTFKFVIRATVAGVGNLTREITVTIAAATVIDPAPPPPGTVGRAYQFQFATKTQEVLP